MRKESPSADTAEPHIQRVESSKNFDTIFQSFMQNPKIMHEVVMIVW
jgi:hypothetical protein